MEISSEFVNGMCLGVEHVSFEEDEASPAGWMIALHLLCFRICFVKFNE